MKQQKRDGWITEPIKNMSLPPTGASYQLPAALTQEKSQMKKWERNGWKKEPVRKCNSAV
jgi:hypothetical protein